MAALGLAFAGRALKKLPDCATALNLIGGWRELVALPDAAAVRPPPLQPVAPAPNHLPGTPFVFGFPN